MKRILLASVVSVLVALSCVALAAGATRSSGRNSTQSRAHLRGFMCQRAVDPLKRSVSVEAVMRPVPHTKKLAIRFDLLGRKRAGGNYSAVRGGDLGTWLTPVGQPNLGSRAGDVWAISHPVTGLPAPELYRYRVTFRWTGDHGRVLATRTLFSQRCFEPELRPDLQVVSVAVASDPGKPKLNRYTALIRNAGATGAGAFSVSFAPPGAAGAGTKTRTVHGLPAHASTQVTFVGPLCTATTAPTITADPSHQVADFNTANNSLAVLSTCPVLTSQ